MLETTIHFLQSLNPIWVYCIIFAIAYIENIFPPSPSDMVIVFGGSLIGIGTIGFFPALFITTLGSTLGFMTMYKIGEWTGVSVIEKRKFKFLPIESIHKVEKWFQKYGYWLIVVNRFLSGTRAVVSFFAGVSQLNLLITTILCFFSALVWNGILLYAGTLLGNNWENIETYFSTYSTTVTIIIILIIVVWLVRYFIKKRKKTNE